MAGKNIGGRWIANPKPITNSDPTGWREGDFGLNTVADCHNEDKTNKGERKGEPKEAGINSKRVTGAYG